MRYELILALVDALKAAQAALPPGTVPHKIYGPDDVHDTGDMQDPPRPSIIVNSLAGQPSPRMSEFGPRRNRLSVDQTRILVAIESLRNYDDPTTQRSLKGYAAQHKVTVDFVRNFIIENDSIPVRAADQAEFGTQPFGLQRDDPFDGISGQDRQGFRHTFFVLVTTTEAVCPLRSL